MIVLVDELRIVVVRLCDPVLVLVLDDDWSRAPAETSEPGEHQPAPAWDPRLPPSRPRHDDPHPERDECHTHEAFHRRADGRRQARRRHDDAGTDCERDRRVPECVHGREKHRAPTRVLRRRDVPEGGDVIPVEAVTEPEDEGGRDQRDVDAGARRHHPRTLGRGVVGFGRVVGLGGVAGLGCFVGCVRVVDLRWHDGFDGRGSTRSRHGEAAAPSHREHGARQRHEDDGEDDEGQRRAGTR